MATDYGNRLRQARKHAKLTQTKLSELTKIPQSTISTAEREGHGSGETPVYAQACGVNALWLATGEGEMLPAFIPTAQTAQTAAVQPLSSPSPPTAWALDLATQLDSLASQDARRRAYLECSGIIQRAKEAESQSSAPNQSSQRAA